MAISPKVEASSSAAGASLQATQLENSQHESFREAAEVEGETQPVEGSTPLVEGDTPVVEGELATAAAVEVDDKNIKMAKKINVSVGANF